MPKLHFNNNQVEDYTIILSNRNHKYYGQLTGMKDVTYNANLNSANEISFTVYKPLVQDYIWENLIDLKLIFVKELNEYFQIKVSIDDANDTTKSVTGISQCEAELSQLILYGMEINSENDITRDKDKVRSTVFYDPEHPDASLLHRILKDKAPHYKIAHVDESLCEVYRVFDSIDGTSIYDFLVGECAEQFDCLFQFNSVDRSISAYDLLTVCKKCGKRGDFDKCPSCGSEDLKHFGQDTTIYVDKNNLTDSIHLEVNSDNIKNCFKLEGGDEVMTGAIRSLNPTGTDYIYIQRQEDLDEMPKELVQKLSNYYEDENAGYYSHIDNYRLLSEQIYDLLDDIEYYRSAMMPTINDDFSSPEDIESPKEGIIYLCGNEVYLYNGETISSTNEKAQFYKDLIPSSTTITAATEAAKITSDALSNIVALKQITKSTVSETVNTTLKNYVKTLVKSGYVKIEIENEDKNNPKAFFDIALDNDKLAVIKDKNNKNFGYHYGYWTGQFKITNYSNDKEASYTEYMKKIVITDNYGEYIKQRVIRDIHSNDSDDGSVFNVLNIKDLKEFECAIKLYSLNRLISFHDAIQSAIDVLITEGQAEKTSLLYNFYKEYNEKLTACEKEMDTRQAKINKLEKQVNSKKAEQATIQQDLNLSKKLGDLYPIFCSYRREDRYSNSNYISDGLSNAELLKRAKEFWETAEKELMKVSNGECTITSTLSNLLLIPAFKPFVDYFELGNWIRVRVEGQLYKLRLIGYSINFDSLQTINVTFSTVTKVENSKTERENIIESAKSFATGMSAISKQVEKGLEANDNINDILRNGLNSGLVQIKNNENEEVIYDKHGILCRSYDDILGKFDDKQLKLTHNTIAFTDNNWKSVRQVIGEHNYSAYDKSINDWVNQSGYGISSDFVQSGQVYGATIVGGKIYSDNYSDGTHNRDAKGTYIDLQTGEFSFGGGTLRFEGGSLIISSPSIPTSSDIINVNEDYLKKTSIYTQNLKIDSANITGTIKADSVDAENITGTTLRGKNIIGGSLLIGNKAGSYAEITEDGILTANNAKFNGDIVGGSIKVQKTTTEEEPYLYVIDGENENRCVSIWGGSICCMDYMPTGEAALDYNCNAVIKTETDDGFAELNGAFVNSFGFNNVSLESKKKNFEHLENGLDILNNIDIYKYHYKTDDDDIKKHIGLVIGDNYNYSEEVTTPDNTSVDLYSLVSVCVKAIQELQNEIAELKKGSSSNIN